jgi:hypothetical protein
VAAIRKDTPPRVEPILGDYEKVCAGFTWSEARAALQGLPGGRGLNIAHEAVDRHAASDYAAAVALRCVGRDDSVTCLTYGELARSTARFANVLRSLGIGHGDRVATLSGRCPELYTVVLGSIPRYLFGDLVLHAPGHPCMERHASAVHGQERTTPGRSSVEGEVEQGVGGPVQFQGHDHTTRGCRGRALLPGFGTDQHHRPLRHATRGMLTSPRN